MVDNQIRQEMSRIDGNCRSRVVPYVPPRQLPEDFPARIRAARGYAGLGRDKFAAEVATEGLSASTIKSYETGPRRATRQ